MADRHSSLWSVERNAPSPTASPFCASPGVDMETPVHRLMPHTLYDPRFEHDGCGIGFVARISGEPSHQILAMALTAVGNLEHRGAVAADAKSGDGAGVLTQIPRALLLRELAARGIGAAGA